MASVPTLRRREGELSLANRRSPYLQLALYLEPSHQLALVSLADIYEAMKKHELAFNVYERIPESSPLKRIADIQAAIDLDSLDRSEEAEQEPEGAGSCRGPDGHRSHYGLLGNIQR